MENKKSNTGLIILIVVLVMIILFGGCLFLLSSMGYVSFGKVNDREEVMEDNKDKEEVKVDDSIAYQSVIQEYRDALNDNSIDGDMDKANEKYKNVSFILFMNFENAKEKIKYSFYDIDSNGQNEMIISEKQDSNNYVIIDLFSYDGSNLIKFPNDGGALLGERASLSIWNNGILYYGASSGAKVGVREFFKLSSNGYSFDKIIEVSYEVNEDNNISFYNGNDKLSYTSFEELEAVYLSNASKVDINNFDWREF